jgi:hypothetical protein
VGVGSLVGPVALALHEHVMGAVDQPVQHALGDDRVGEQPVPVGRRPVGGQHSAAVVEDLRSFPAVGGVPPTDMIHCDNSVLPWPCAGLTHEQAKFGRCTADLRLLGGALPSTPLEAARGKAEVGNALRDGPEQRHDQQECRRDTLPPGPTPSHVRCTRSNLSGRVERRPHHAGDCCRQVSGEPAHAHDDDAGHQHHYGPTTRARRGWRCSSRTPRRTSRQGRHRPAPYVAVIDGRHRRLKQCRTATTPRRDRG